MHQLGIKHVWRHPRGWWGLGLHGAGLSVLSRGFAACPHARCFSGVLCFRVHSQRETWVPVPRPHGFAYCKSSREQRVGSPAGQYSEVSPSLIRPRQSTLGTAHLVSHRLVSAEPRALTATRPLGHPPVFPHVRRKAVCLSR